MQNQALARLVGVVFGVCFTAVGLLGVRAGLAASNWPSEPARIIVSERAGLGDHRYGNIVAEFRVGEAVYHCGHVTSGRNNSTWDVSHWPVGKPVRVWHDPVNFSKCVLVPGISGGSLGFLATGLGMFGLALYAHWSLRRQRA